MYNKDYCNDQADHLYEAAARSLECVVKLVNEKGQTKWYQFIKRSSIDDSISYYKREAKKFQKLGDKFKDLAKKF